MEITTKIKLETAIEAQTAAQAAWEALPDGEDAAAEAALDAADAEVTRLRQALRESDCPRQWMVTYDGESGDYSEVTAASGKEALDEACSEVDRGSWYPDAQGTIWVDVRVNCELTHEEDARTVTLHEEEPECSSADVHHDWQSPVEIVGGIDENPGVQGHGGGVILDEVCMICGCGRQTDTWAQRPDTGEQGMESIEHAPHKYGAELVGLYRRAASWSWDAETGRGTCETSRRTLATARRVDDEIEITIADGYDAIVTEDNLRQVEGWTETPWNRQPEP